ncbi:MAG: hypothetical protein L6Q29_03495 [Candidatus Pacebacteria bacterium]|nr:hypothetical protein [Candidatus Paceibacterota bacterium]NUQ57521.1 hypothetical protein [Candidatus Paceibacter sp.]
MFGKITIRKSDKLFREYTLKTRPHRCEHCGRQYPEGKGLELSHFYGRRSESTRQHPENIDLLCSGCHRIFHERPASYVEWKKNKMGEKEFAKLTLRANSIQKKDEKLAIIYWREKLKELEK